MVSVQQVVETEEEVAVAAKVGKMFHWWVPSASTRVPAEWVGVRKRTSHAGRTNSPVQRKRLPLVSQTPPPRDLLDENLISRSLQQSTQEATTKLMVVTKRTRMRGNDQQPCVLWGSCVRSIKLYASSSTTHDTVGVVDSYQHTLQPNTQNETIPVGSLNLTKERSTVASFMVVAVKDVSYCRRVCMYMYWKRAVNGMVVVVVWERRNADEVRDMCVWLPQTVFIRGEEKRSHGCWKTNEVV